MCLLDRSSNFFSKRLRKLFSPPAFLISLFGDQQNDNYFLKWLIVSRKFLRNEMFCLSSEF